MPALSDRVVAGWLRLNYKKDYPFVFASSRVTKLALRRIVRPLTWRAHDLVAYHHRLACGRPIRFDYERPIVSFTFDDFPASAYRIAGKILEEFGFRATYFTAMGLMDTTNHLGKHFSKRDLCDLHEAGHEVACHTYSHLTCSDRQPDEFEGDVKRNSAAIASELRGVVPAAFSFPKGVVKVSHQRQLNHRFRCLRTTSPGINRETFDLNYVRAIRVYERKFDLGVLSDMLRELEQRPGWLVFYTHDVRDNPSRFGTSRSLFEAIVAKVAAADVQVSTFSAALDRLGAPETEAQNRTTSSSLQEIEH